MTTESAHSLVNPFPTVAGSDFEYTPPALAPFPDRMWHALRSLERRVQMLENALQEHINPEETEEPE